MTPEGISYLWNGLRTSVKPEEPILQSHLDTKIMAGAKYAIVCGELELGSFVYVCQAARQIWI